MESKTTETFKMWLIGEPCNQFRGDKLPSNLEVLCRFAHFHCVEKKTIRKSATATTTELVAIWSKCRIHTRKPYNVATQIEKYYESYLNLKKHKNDKSKNQRDKENNFKVLFYDLFDVAHADILQMEMEKKDMEFLVSQRKPGREGFIKRSAIPTQNDQTTNHDQIVQSNDRAEQANHDQNEVISAQAHEVVNEEEMDFHSDDGNFSDVSSGDEYVPRKKSKHSSSEIKTKVSVFSAELANTLDRYKVSDEAAAAIIFNVLHNLGIDIDNTALSVSTIRRFRIDNRIEMYDDIKSSFSPDSILTIHWDEKKMRNIDDTEKVEKMVAAVSCGKSTKLLDVRELPDGKGKSKATALVDILNDWGISGNVKFMCFDTTSTNSGKNKGACRILQKLLHNEDLISLACRHHVLELVIGAVFQEMMEEVTKSPDIEWFENFANSFHELNKDDFESGITEPRIEKVFRQDKNGLIQFINDQITLLKQTNGGRGDYIEFLELCLLFLGETTSLHSKHKISIHKPGGYSRARWMAKVIYCLKMFLFRDQLELEAEQLLNLSETCIFIVKVYLKNWMLCQLPTKAATNDLQMLKDLHKYKSINQRISEVSFEKLGSHTWYLNEVVVAFSFFDDEIETSTKKRMVENLMEKQGRKGNILLPQVNKKTISKLRIEDFVTQKTQLFFEICYGKGFFEKNNFLLANPGTWDSDEQYIAGSKFVKNLLIVNDVAERYIALASSFNKDLAKSKEQKKCLLHVVEDNRHRFPKKTCKKKFVGELSQSSYN